MRTNADSEGEEREGETLIIAFLYIDGDVNFDVYTVVNFGGQTGHSSQF